MTAILAAIGSFFSLSVEVIKNLPKLWKYSKLKQLKKKKVKLNEAEDARDWNKFFNT